MYDEVVSAHSVSPLVDIVEAEVEGWAAVVGADGRV